MTVAIEFKPVSLLERIKKAGSNDELLLLEAEGVEYEYARNKTRHKWEKAIQRRKSQLSKSKK